MRSLLAAELRAAATAPLPERAFLRRDRGDALFVTDAPLHDPRADWAAAFAPYGLDCREENGLLRLSPGASRLIRLEAGFPNPPDALCASLRRFAGLPPQGESLRLFALGARVLDGAAEEAPRFERLLRQRAALCLREPRNPLDGSHSGGGLYACALLTHAIKEECAMKLRWLGHACFELTLPGGVIVTDPYDDSVGYPPLRVRADAVLSSHGHHDHNWFAAVEGDPAILNAPGAHEACGARITAVPSFHDGEGGAKRGPNLIHVIEAEGLRVAHLGDLGHLPDTDEQRAALSNLDVMLIPIGGFYTIDTPTAVKIIETYKPRCAVAMHFANAWCHFPVSDEGEFMRLTGAKRLPNAVEVTKDAPVGCAVMAL